MDVSGWSYVDNISPGRKHPQCLRQTRPLADVLFQPRTETSSLLAANASVSGSAVSARVGDILIVGVKRVRLFERLFQAGFIGNRIGGFRGTSLQSNMGSDVYACKELVAALRRLVARSFDQASNGSLCPSTSFLRRLQVKPDLSYTAGHPFFEMSCSFTCVLRGCVGFGVLRHANQLAQIMRGKIAHCASGGIPTPSTGIPGNFLFSLQRTWDQYQSSGLMLLKFTTTPNSALQMLNNIG